MRPLSHLSLQALGLPRAWSYKPVPPRFDTRLVTWPVRWPVSLRIDGEETMTRAALSLWLVALEHKGLIADLQTHTPISKRLLLKATFRYTHKGERLIARVLHECYLDEDE